MEFNRRTTAAAVGGFLIGALAASVGWAAGRAELEIVRQPRVPVTAMQQWSRALGEAGLSSVRIREARGGDRIGIEKTGTEASPVYRVTGSLSTSGELILPGGRYRAGEARRVARWLEELAARGLPEERPARSAFGLTAEQFAQVRADLARPVAFSTRDAARSEVVQRVGRQLQIGMLNAADGMETLSRDKVAEELSGLSSGTALACALRPAGYALVPRASGERIGYAIVRMQEGMEIWPIGWEPEKSRKETLPALYEFLNVNIQGVSAQQALDAIAGRLKVPCLLDHNALARHGIDPAKETVSLPGGRTFYSKALERVLFQAGLKSELRVDEAGRPLLWVTTIKPM